MSIAQYLNQSLGAALLVQEENTSEYQGAFRNQESCDTAVVADTYEYQRPSIQRKITDATVTVQIKIYAEFECNERTKKSNHTK